MFNLATRERGLEMAIRESKFRFFGVGIVAVVFVCITSYLQQTGHGRLSTTGQKDSDPNQVKTAEKSCAILPASLNNSLHDAPVVHDVAAFRFNRILKETGRIWPFFDSIDFALELSDFCFESDYVSPAWKEFRGSQILQRIYTTVRVYMLYILDSGAKQKGNPG
jgi:hypothetical protein